MHKNKKKFNLIFTISRITDFTKFLLSNTIQVFKIFFSKKKIPMAVRKLFHVVAPVKKNCFSPVDFKFYSLPSLSAILPG